MKIRELSIKDTNILKGIAILCIVLHNFFHWLDPARGIENEFWFSANNINSFASALISSPLEFINIIFSYLGHYGVQIFIFISGYGLAVSAKRNTLSWGKFMQNRMRKIYPLLIIALLFFFLFSIYINYRLPVFKELRSMFYKLLFVHTLIPNEGLSLNGPWWFFGLIVQLYMLFPLLFRLINKHNTKALFGIWLISYLIVFPFVLSVVKLPSELYIMQNFPGHAPEFALGIWFALNTDKKINPIWFVAAAAFFVLGNFHIAFYPFTFLSISYMSIVAYMSVRRCESRFLEFFGTISMFLFATHGQFRWPLVVASQKEGTWLGTLFISICYLALITIVALAAKKVYPIFSRCSKNKCR